MGPSPLPCPGTVQSGDHTLGPKRPAIPGKPISPVSPYGENRRVGTRAAGHECLAVPQEPYRGPWAWHPGLPCVGRMITSTQQLGTHRFREGNKDPSHAPPGHKEGVSIDNPVSQELLRAWRTTSHACSISLGGRYGNMAIARRRGNGHSDSRTTPQAPMDPMSCSA